MSSVVFLSCILGAGSVAMLCSGLLVLQSRGSNVSGTRASTPSTVKANEPKPSTSTKQVSVEHGRFYTISSASGTFIGHDFDKSRGKGKMCDAVGTTKGNGAKFKFTKEGSDWTIATDCDGDSNFTSFLTGGKDLIAARDKKTPSTQAWTVACTGRGCSLKNKKLKKFLGGSFESPSYSSTEVIYRLSPA